MALFESYERRIDKINSVLNSYGIASIEEAEKITKDAGLDVYAMVKGIQPICFENACWAYTVGAAIAIKKGCKKASEAAAAIGEGLQAFCIPGSVADQRKVGLGHGNLFLRKRRSVLHSLQDMSHLQQQRALSVSLRRLTRFVRSLLELSLTDLVRMLHRLSQESTDLHMLRQRWIIQQARLRKYSVRHTQTDFVLRLTATALMT